MKKPPKLSRREMLLMLAAIGGSTQVAAANPRPDPVRMDPRSYRVAFENDKIRVLEYYSKPGLGICGIGMHYHPAHLTISLTGGRARVKRPDGTVRFGETKPGQMFWSPAENHEVENISGHNAHLYIVEVKDAAWKESTG